MELQDFLQVVFAVIPAVIVGFVAYSFFKMHTDNEEGRRRYIIHKEAQRAALPLRLQAYERLALFLERIDPGKLLIRLSPQGSNKHDYEDYVISQIEQEYEHNLTQQIYVSAECWNIITTAKNATIQTIRKTNMSERVDSANKFREVMLTDLFEKQSPSSIALAHLKNEVSGLWTD
ncbi:hypothetical protein GR160_04785 [Flavobacterium sp. Sd200]|uniref:DUF7935 family protein n=1 Tax=Flavobacterium sp. Sd200 TaxID=2692211 RepID=UPI001371FD30|nr:hypothetical protein [Flavobacterium sp. Sd200]MXN90533.1 hypothetical protein [Flavobacterium sp. Sd200]